MTRFARLIGEIANVGRFGGPRLTGVYLYCIARRCVAIAKSKSLGPADRLMPQFLKIRNRRTLVKLNSGDFGVVREIFGANCYAHKDWLDRSRSFLDLGANEGVFTLYALSYDPLNTVVAVEAQPQLAQRLKQNLKLNNYTDRCASHCGFVGDINDQLKDLEHNIAPINMAEIVARLGRIDFLKVDVEGSEFTLFRNCENWIHNIQFIAMEVHPSAGDPEVLANDLTRLGFVASQYSSHGKLGYLFLENQGNLARSS